MHMKQRKMKGENPKGFKNWNGNFLVYHKYNMFKNNKATEMTKIIQSILIAVKNQYCVYCLAISTLIWK